MGLRNKLALGEWVRTNQRELDYGDNAPLIPQKKLPAPGELSENPLASTINDITDNFIPGGLLYGTERAATDTLRITKFLATGEGIAFAAKDSAGQLMNPESLISPTNKTRTPLNLLAQIPSNIAGLHFRRDGLLDTDIENNFNYGLDRGGVKYEKEFRTLLNLEPDGRLIENSSISALYDNNNTLLGVYGRLKLEPDSSLIKEYSGGADSTFGIGTTTIKKYENVARPNEDYIQQQLNKEKEKVRGLGKYKIGDPGSSPSINGEYRYNSPTVDQINVADIFPRFNFEANEEAESLNDLIKFRIALIDTTNPLNDEVLLFRAFIENVNDNFSGNWNSHTYNGRAEKFYTYNNFDRKIDFNFKVAPQSLIELKPLYKKLNYLAGSTAPVYVNRRMRGRYVRLTIGDWLYELPGFFSNIGLSWSNNFPWELNPDGSDALSQHPMILNVNCSFTPIHDFTPENKVDSPFIIRRERQGNKVLWPNSPKPTPVEPIGNISPQPLSTNTPTPELQQISQTNLNNQVTGQTENIQFSRTYSEGGGVDRFSIDYGTVNKIPEIVDEANPNNIINHLVALEAVQMRATPQPPTEAQQAEAEETRANRPRSIFM